MPTLEAGRFFGSFPLLIHTRDREQIKYTGGVGIVEVGDTTPIQDMSNDENEDRNLASRINSSRDGPLDDGRSSGSAVDLAILSAFLDCVSSETLTARE